jgi:bifunctional DNA-binding transcriptional regulator/antitoxin component of YhaV-PrlF toxin-antitoxin module
LLVSKLHARDNLWQGPNGYPAKARKEAHLGTGDVVSVRPEGDGRILLVRLEQPKSTKPVRAKIIYRKGKHPVGDIGRRITREEIKAALADFPLSKPPNHLAGYR